MVQIDNWRNNITWLSMAPLVSEEDNGLTGEIALDFMVMRWTKSNEIEWVRLPYLVVSKDYSSFMRG